MLDAHVTTKFEEPKKKQEEEFHGAPPYLCSYMHWGCMLQHQLCSKYSFEVEKHVLCWMRMLQQNVRNQKKNKKKSSMGHPLICVHICTGAACCNINYAQSTASRLKSMFYVGCACYNKI